MKRARPLFLYIVFALLCAISPFARAAAYEAHGLAKYWESGPVRPGDHFLVKINIYILPGDGVIAEVSGQAAATQGIGISSIVGPGGNKKTGGSFAFTGSGFSGLSIDLKAAVKEGASENERITIYGVTAKLRNGTVLNVPQMTVNVPVAVQHTHTMQAVSRTEPTCTEEGEAILQCAGCGERVRQALAATGHSYGDMLAVPPRLRASGRNVCGLLRVRG